MGYVGKRRRGGHRTNEVQTVADLVELLEKCDPELEVRLAFQPRWPSEHEVGQIAVTADTLWIADGGQIGQLPESAITELEWR